MKEPPRSFHATALFSLLFFFRSDIDKSAARGYNYNLK